MSKQIVSAAIATAIALGALAPAAMAKSAPKTKAACEKISTMRWDDGSGKCVKK